MIQHVNEDDFHAAFNAVRPENFTFLGRRALFDHFEQIEHDIGEPITLDVIAICCEYTQYHTIREYNEAYGTSFSDWAECADNIEQLVIAFGTFSAIVQNH